MRITHVVRGVDHISNTPKQILLYRALGTAPPQFAHVPLILGPDRKRLSKRHGATSVMEYQRLGYLAEAMVNFLVLLGWSPGETDRELFTRDELSHVFSLEGIAGADAVFNIDKLDWFNGQHLGRLSAEEIARRLAPILREAGLWRDEFAGAQRDWLERFLDLYKPRVRRLGDFVQFLPAFIADTVEYDSDAVTKHLTHPNLAAHLTALRTALAGTDPFDPAAIERTVREVAERAGVKAATLIHASRVAVTGKAVSPGLFDVLALIGRDRTVSRLIELERFLSAQQKPREG
jgi:glutamyl/glutaminyl-tRNA synthetase